VSKARSHRLRWLAVLVLLALGEIVFRAVFPAPEVRNFNRILFTPLGHLAAGTAGRGRRAPLRNVRVTWASDPDGVEFEHTLNLYGFRGPDFEIAKTPERRRVVFIGDSIVEGVGVADAATLPAVYQELAGDGVEVINLGVSASNLFGYLRLARVAVPLLEPDVVIVVLYANDLPVAPYDDGPETAPPQPVARRAWMPRALDAMAGLLTGDTPALFYHRGPFPFFRPVPHPSNPLSGAPEGDAADVDSAVLAAMKAGRFNGHLRDAAHRAERRLREPLGWRTGGGPELLEIRDLVRAHAGRLVVAYVPMHVAVSDHYRSAWNALGRPFEAPTLTTHEFRAQAASVASFAARLKLPFVDFTAAIERVEAEGERLYLAYDSHMNERGYALLARVLEREARGLD